MPKAILFDIDGTLVDSNNFHVLAWAEALHAAGHDFRLRELHHQIGQGTDNFVRALLPRASEGEVAALGEAHGRLFRQHYAHRLKPFPRASDLLRRCRDAGLKVVLATSASESELQRNLEVLGAQCLVDGWVDADDVARSKPCPDVFEAALAKAGVAADEALAVGDTPFDIEAAGRIGIATVAVRSGLFSDETLVGAVAIYDDVEELLERFDESPLVTRA